MKKQMETNLGGVEWSFYEEHKGFLLHFFNLYIKTLNSEKTNKQTRKMDAKSLLDTSRTLLLMTLCTCPYSKEKTQTKNRRRRRLKSVSTCNLFLGLPRLYSHSPKVNV